MDAPNRTIIATADGSHTVQLGDSGETYHSTHGALQESMLVYIELGLDYVLQQYPGQAISIFEMGFGTGLNAFLTALAADENQATIRYTTYELFPLKTEEAALLNYPSSSEERAIFSRIHQAEWENLVQVTPNFSIEKKKEDITAFDDQQRYHLIYYDAFSPIHQPELWTTAIFQKLYNALLPGGILVTYCSKSEVRRNLAAAGFIVSKLPGPRGKREVLRAIKAESL